MVYLSVSSESILFFEKMTSNLLLPPFYIIWYFEYFTSIKKCS